MSAGFALLQVRTYQVCPHIDSSSNQVLQICLSHTERESMHNETKHVYFLFFNPLKVTDKLEIHVESLGRVHGGELAM